MIEVSVIDLTMHPDKIVRSDAFLIIGSSFLNHVNIYLHTSQSIVNMEAMK